jgi:hypothetical protein
LDIGLFVACVPTLLLLAAAETAVRFTGLPSFERMAEIHLQYATATREVATALGVPIVDMIESYRTHGDAPRFGAGDMIHPTQAGPGSRGVAATVGHVGCGG